MRKQLLLLVTLVLLAGAAYSQMSGGASQAAKPTLTVGQALDRELATAEREIVPLAEEMPEDKYGYAPSQGEFKGVRNFGQQLKHIASANYMLFAVIAEEKPPADLGQGENGPDSVRTKAEIVKYLKDSYTYGHKVLKAMDDKTLTKPTKTPWGSESTPVSMATLTIGHNFNHYGQLVVYARSNGMVPPASRQQ